MTGFKSKRAMAANEPLRPARYSKGITILKKEYWDAIINEYYDNVHWSRPGPPSIYQWLKSDYNAETGLTSIYIHFEHEKDYMWFMLRWSEQCAKSI